MSDINPSAIGEKFDAEFEAQIAACSTAAEISELMKSRSVQIGLVTRDIYSPDVLIPVNGPVPQKFARAVTINGTRHIVEADSELALEKSMGELYRAELQPAAAVEPAEQPRNESGQFVTAEDAAAKAMLELAFKRGDVSASDYLERSGAIAEYLEKAGVPLEDLKAQVQDQHAAQFHQSWTEATETFLHSAAGASWPGGELNRDTLGRILTESNLVDSEDKVGALAAAYNYAVENELLVPNEEVERQNQISEARSPAELRELLQPVERQKRIQEIQTNGLFNR